MGRKSKKPAFKLSRFSLLSLVFLLLISIFAVFYNINSRLSFTSLGSNSSQPQTTEATTSATKENPITSPTPIKPTPTLTKPQVYIPPVSGNQIRVPILTYHYIGNNPNPADKARDALEVSPDKFEAQMKYLSETGYTPITLDTMYAVLKKQASLPAKPIILTFDDGYIDFYLNAYPILRRFGFHAIEFIPTGLIGTAYYMNWGQIKEMHSSGLINFQAHTVHHSNLTALSDSALNFEITESKKTLEAQLGAPVNWIAYPYGISDLRVQQAVKKSGFVGAAGTWRSTIQSEGTIFNMPRIKVSGNIDLQTFKSLL